MRGGKLGEDLDATGGALVEATELRKSREQLFIKRSSIFSSVLVGDGCSSSQIRQPKEFILGDEVEVEQ